MGAIIGVIFVAGFFGLGALYLFPKNVACPKCGGPVSVPRLPAFLKPPSWCEKCEDFRLPMPGGTLAEVPEGYIADLPVFVALFRWLKPSQEWRPLDPTKCCVCEKPAERVMKVSLTISATPLGLVTIRESTVPVVIAHCARCQDGIASHSFPTGDMEYGVGFRSYRQWKSFMAANGTSAPRGIWRPRPGRAD